jgi:hypothetical protein
VVLYNFVYSVYIPKGMASSKKFLSTYFKLNIVFNLEYYC